MTELRNVDLNLLVAFDALMSMRHVSRAADRLGISQPGMSASLARLRELFKDPLLVRQGTSMIPTSRALTLEPEIRKVLRHVTDLIEPPEIFNPATSKRRFRLRMSDLLTVLAVPELAVHLADEAPGVRLEIRHLSPVETIDALERDDIDLAVSAQLEVPKSIAVSPLFEDRLVCVCRLGIELGNALKRPEALAKLPHVRVSQSPIDDRFADRQLAAAGLRRNTVLTVPHWLAVPDIVAAGNFVALMPASVAIRLAARVGLDIRPIDCLDTKFEWSLYWHRRYGSDPGHEWLREGIMERFRMSA